MIKRFCDMTGKEMIGRNYAELRFEDTFKSSVTGKKIEVLVRRGTSTVVGNTRLDCGDVGVDGFVLLLRKVIERLKDIPVQATSDENCSAE